LSAANYSFTFQDGQFTVTSSTTPLVKSSPIISAAPAMQAIRLVPGGVRITFTGMAGHNYQVERSAAFQSNSTAWEPVGTSTTDSAGHGEFTDTNPLPTQGYYRAVSQ
jgi:hypothetical protein